jgi:hypothetical protein
MSEVLAEQKIALDMGDYLKLLPHRTRPTASSRPCWSAALHEA